MAEMPKTALVTGGAKRLGRAIALALADAGFAVAVHYRHSESEAAETKTAIANKGVRATALAADFADEDAVKTIVTRARACIGPLGVLVNNASVFENDTTETMTRESWDRHIAVNLRAPVVLAQDFARQLPAGAEGAIVNLLDQRLLKPTPNFLSYGTSKAGLHWLTRTLAQGLAPRIRVNAVAPGPTLPNRHQSEAQFRRQSAATALGRGATPVEVAQAVLYLVQARAVTGAMITVDGGQHLVWNAPDAKEGGE